MGTIAYVKKDCILFKFTYTVDNLLLTFWDRARVIFCDYFEQVRSLHSIYPTIHSRNHHTLPRAHTGGDAGRPAAAGH